jgi:hypothetical protein
MNFLSGNLTAVEFLGTLNKSVSTLAAFAFIGSLLATSFLLPEREGSFEKGSLALRKKLRIFGFIWLATSAFSMPSI